MIILLSGAAGAGKDTVANMIFNDSRIFMKEKFSTPLKDLAYMIHGQKYCVREYEATKDTPLAAFDGKTPRQAIIWADQHVFRPTLGDEYLGRLLVKRCDSKYNYVISDSGFQEEAWPVIDFFHPHNVIHVDVQRPEHTYENDSRSAWRIKGITYREIENNGGEDQLKKKVSLLLQDIGM